MTRFGQRFTKPKRFVTLSNDADSDDLKTFMTQTLKTRKASANHFSRRTPQLCEKRVSVCSNKMRLPEKSNPIRTILPTNQSTEEMSIGPKFQPRSYSAIRMTQKSQVEKQRQSERLNTIKRQKSKTIVQMPSRNEEPFLTINTISTNNLDRHVSNLPIKQA